MQRERKLFRQASVWHQLWTWSGRLFDTVGPATKKPTAGMHPHSGHQKPSSLVLILTEHEWGKHIAVVPGVSAVTDFSPPPCRCALFAIATCNRPCLEQTEVHTIFETDSNFTKMLSYSLFYCHQNRWVVITAASTTILRLTARWLDWK